tara:strand:+ start:5914 stop:6519 length:606 start_codon:yes stop_codon:yes gene_type:complete
MSGLWKIIEKTVGTDFPQHLDDTDKCYYARDYISQGGYQSSETNDLISNFKKSTDRKNKPEWHYKKIAIERFATELSLVIRDKMSITCIPSSKCTTDPDYDFRLEETLLHLKEKKPLINIEYPLKVSQTTLASHLGGSRDISTIYANLKWDGFTTPPEKLIILIDDVITSGAHFKACKKKFLEHHPGIEVLGLFWAKTVSK